MKILLDSIFIKIAMMIGFLIISFFFYGLIQRRTLKLNKQYDLSNPIDKKTKIRPYRIWIYMSLKFVMIISVFFLDINSTINIIKTFFCAEFIGILFYIAIPSSYPRKGIIKNIDSIFYKKFYKLLHKRDLPNNTFPSLHVAYSLISSYFLIVNTNNNYTNILITIYPILISI